MAEECYRDDLSPPQARKWGRPAIVVIVAVAWFVTAGIMLTLVYISDNYIARGDPIYNDLAMAGSFNEFPELEQPGTVTNNPYEANLIYAYPREGLYDRPKIKSISCARINRLKMDIRASGYQDRNLLAAVDLCRGDPEKLPILRPVGGMITSRFGYRRDPITKRRSIHKGVDIWTDAGTPVKAAAAGVVKVCGWQGGYGRVIYLDHGNGFSTRYGHLSKFKTRKGQRVERGDTIGLVGKSGRATGPHLHYEVRWLGEAVDPEPFLIDRK